VAVAESKHLMLVLDFASKGEKMELIKFFAGHKESILNTNREEKELLIGFLANSRKQQEKLLAELNEAEKIWQTSDQTVKSSSYLW